MDRKVADLFVDCLIEEGVEFIFGLPGEENIDFVEALNGRPIRFILTRHEQGASFMADIYGRLTRKAGVCLATLGPGAINLTLGAADAQLDSSPLVAIAGQASRNRIFKEFHQYIDLLELFRPITKWGGRIMLPETTPEVIRKAFKVAGTERPGATLIVLPEDVAAEETDSKPIPAAFARPTEPNLNQVARAVELLKESKNPVVLAGHGVCRSKASEALTAFAEKLGIPVVTTFMAKGVIPYDSEYHLGAIGFMKYDYVNLGLDKADTVIAVGYDIIEYPAEKWNPEFNKNIIHIHTGVAEVDQAYSVDIGIQGDISLALKAIASNFEAKLTTGNYHSSIKKLLEEEMVRYAGEKHFPVKPQQLVAATRAALDKDDIVLCDTGALKMWMARLFPCYYPDTCLFSNGLGTMGFAVPGALAAKLVHPEKAVVAVTGDGSFLMNSQELETAKRENIPFVVLIWKDSRYGLIEWKQNLKFGHRSFVSFDNPDFVKYAESFGIKGYSIKSADEITPVLRQAIANNELAVIECEVDYSENTALTDKLGTIVPF
jgi:acetolactate synthase-1/2/3 large subunit